MEEPQVRLIIDPGKAEKESGVRRQGDGRRGGGGAGQKAASREAAEMRRLEARLQAGERGGGAEEPGGSALP
jgi:hypothetical protein